MSDQQRAAVDVLPPNSFEGGRQPEEIVALWLKRSALVLDETERDAVCARYTAFKQMFGTAPVFSSESAAAYEFILLDLLDRYRPACTDVVVVSLIAQLLDSIWEIKRCTQHKKLIVDLKHEQLLRRRVKQRAAESKDKSALIFTGFMGDDLDADVDISSEPPANERDDARALGGSLGHYYQLDNVLQHCLRTYERALDMLDMYSQPEFSGGPRQ